MVTLALAAFHTPTILTGRFLVSDAPVPEGWEGVAHEAQHGVGSHLEGLYGLRLAGLTCNGSLPTVYFDVLGPFATVRAVVASSSGPSDFSTPAWRVRVLMPTPEHPDAASFIAPDARRCEPVLATEQPG